jgi:hypothetical protein
MRENIVSEHIQLRIFLFELIRIGIDAKNEDTPFFQDVYTRLTKILKNLEDQERKIYKLKDTLSKDAQYDFLKKIQQDKEFTILQVAKSLMRNLNN